MNLPITDRKLIAAIAAIISIVFVLLVSYGSYHAGVHDYKQKHMRYCTIQLKDGRTYTARTHVDRKGFVYVQDILFTQPWNRWVPLEVAQTQDSTLRNWDARHFRPTIQD